MQNTYPIKICNKWTFFPSLICELKIAEEAMCSNFIISKWNTVDLFIFLLVPILKGKIVFFLWTLDFMVLTNSAFKPLWKFIFFWTLKFLIHLLIPRKSMKKLLTNEYSWIHSNSYYRIFRGQYYIGTVIIYNCTYLVLVENEAIIQSDLNIKVHRLQLFFLRI